MAGNGATIVLVPSPPIQLTNDATLTSDGKVGFTWKNGPSSGGRPILDYTVWYDQSLNEYVLLEQNIPTQSYVTKVALIRGHTYKFKVQARNDVGLSSFSSEVAILVATLP